MNDGELLGSSDFVSLHVPLTDETRHLIGAGELALMKSTGYLINTARGGLLDHAALSAALAANRLAGAALDVFESEPDLPDALLATENVVLTPHMASSALEAKQDQRDMILANLDAHFAGRPLPTPIP